jgi:dTDP-glucose 4,6-dehydratase
MAASDHPGPINVGSPHEISMLELAETIRQLAGSSSQITFIERPTDDPTVRRPDITLARELLGWEPTTPFEDGLKRTLTWFREQMKMPFEV